MKRKIAVLCCCVVLLSGLPVQAEELGENHPDTAWSYHSIGKWYFYQKDYKKALEHFHHI